MSLEDQELRDRLDQAEAERDRLRAVVEAAHAFAAEGDQWIAKVKAGPVTADDAGRQVRMAAAFTRLVAEYDRGDVSDDIADRWALAIAERDAAEAERDRLRAVAEAARDLLVGIDPWGSEGFILVSTPKLSALRELVQLDGGDKEGT